MKIPKIDIDRLEFYLLLGVLFCFIGAAVESAALAFLLAGVILLLVYFNGLSAAKQRAKGAGNGTSGSN